MSRRLSKVVSVRFTPEEHIAVREHLSPVAVSAGLRRLALREMAALTEIRHPLTEQSMAEDHPLGSYGATHYSASTWLVVGHAS